MWWRVLRAKRLLFTSSFQHRYTMSSPNKYKLYKITITNLLELQTQIWEPEDHRLHPQVDGHSQCLCLGLCQTSNSTIVSSSLEKDMLSRCRIDERPVVVGTADFLHWDLRTRAQSMFAPTGWPRTFLYWIRCHYERWLSFITQNAKTLKTCSLVVWSCSNTYRTVDAERCFEHGDPDFS